MNSWIERTKGGRWTARIRGTGVSESKTFPLKRDAQAWLDSQATALAEGSWISRTAGRVLMRDAAKDYVASRVDVRSGTLKRYRTDLRWINGTFGDVNLVDITRHDIQAWINKMADDGAAASTISNRYQTLSQILADAVGDCINRSPCHKINLPAIIARTPHFLTLAQVEQLADTIIPEYRAFVLLKGTAGLRIGEMAGLRRHRIDFMRGRVHVAEQMVQEVGSRPQLGPVKSKTSERTIPLDPVALQALVAHVDQFEVGEEDLLFTTPEGSALRVDHFRPRHFYPAVEKAGLGKLVPHDLRHTAISLWIAAGINPKAVQVMAGHASIKITFDVYGHLFDNYDEQVVSGFERLRQAEAERSEGPVVPIHSRAVNDTASVLRRSR